MTTAERKRRLACVEEDMRILKIDIQRFTADLKALNERCGWTR